MVPYQCSGVLVTMRNCSQFNLNLFISMANISICGGHELLKCIERVCDMAELRVKFMNGDVLSEFNGLLEHIGIRDMLHRK